MVLGIATGCGDTLLGYQDIEARIGGQPLPAGSEWEVRWVAESGLAVACERVDAGVEGERIAEQGLVELPVPSLPAPRWVEREGYRFALALLVLVAPGTAYPEVGDGWDSLEHDGTWGSSAPMGWLQVEGDLEAAGTALLTSGGTAPAASWAVVDAEAVWDAEAFGAVLESVPTEEMDGLEAIELSWMDDAAYATWSGATSGGISSSCGDP